MDAPQEFAPERRRCLRQRMHAPAFASFDGVSGGMILDLSEEGMSMQMGTRLADHVGDAIGIEKNIPVRMEVDLPEPAAHLETTGYIAWADALGRAGVRFSDLPEEARQRLKEWMTVNAGAPSHMAPKVALERAWGWGRGSRPEASADRGHVAVSLEAETSVELDASGNSTQSVASSTVQYEFLSLGTDLMAVLRLIAERACALTRGSSAAIALVNQSAAHHSSSRQDSARQDSADQDSEDQDSAHQDSVHHDSAHQPAVTCRASVGPSAPALGTRLDVNSGLSGECLREGRALRCDDAENDPRVDLESCRRLGVRSMLAAPVRYERDTVGLLMVFAPEPFNFDEGDVAVVESLAHTVVRGMRQAEVLGRGLAAG